MINYNNYTISQIFSMLTKSDFDSLYDYINVGDVNIIDKYQMTLLMYSSVNISQDDYLFAKALIEKNADLNKVSETKNTALILATSNNNIKVVELLIENGADWGILNDIGESFLDVFVNEIDRINIINKYPKQYNNYLKHLKTKEFNI